MADDLETTLNADWGGGSSLPAAGPLLVTESDLVRWLSAQFQTFPGCSSVTVQEVVRLETPDCQGCNWSRTLVLDPGSAKPEDYGAAYAAILERARQAFNLKPPHPDENSAGPA